MKRWVLLGLLACALGAAAEEAATTVAGLGFSLTVGGDDRPRVEWSIPPALAGEFSDATSDAERDAVAVARLRREESGNRAYALMLGYLYLYGIAGVPLDLDAAEPRLRIELEDGNPDGMHRLAYALSRMTDGDRNLPRAAEITLELLAVGHAPSADLALWLAKRPELKSEEANPKDPSWSERLLVALLEMEPGRGNALVELAHLRQRQKNFEATFDLATRALDDEDLKAIAAGGDAQAISTVRRARLLRMQAAGAARRTAELTPEDLRNITSDVPAVGLYIILALAAIPGLAMLGLWIWLTRRGGARGPNIWVTITWILVPPLALSVGLLGPGPLALVAGILLLAVLLALTPTLRRIYIPIGRIPAKAIGRGALMLLVGFLVVLLANAVYSAAFEWLTGRPLEDQFIRVLMRFDTPLNATLTVFSIAVAIPIFEEILYRGFLTDWLRRRLQPWPATLIATVVFGFMHGVTYAFPTGMIGFVAGWMRLRTGSLWLPILFHMLINAIGVAVLAAG